MPINQLVPNVTEIDEDVFYWPAFLAAGGWQIGDALDRDAWTRFSGVNTGLSNFWAPPVGGGFGVLMALFNDVPTARFINAAGGVGIRTYTVPTMRFTIPLSTTGVPDLGNESVYPRPHRVIRFSWLMRCSVNNPTGGVMISHCQNAAPANFAYCFGVCGDGAGNYRWYTNRTGVVGNVTEAVALALANPAQMHLFEMEVIGAVGTGNASVNLYVDNVPVLSRAFIPGGVLPLYSDGPVNAMNSCLNIDSDDGSLVANGEIQVGPMTLVFSRYTRAGVKIAGPGG